MPDQPSQLLRRNHFWIRDANNPVFPLGEEGSFDCTSTMNSNLVRRGDELWLYYAGGDNAGHRRICLATAPANRAADASAWTRHGPVLDVGEPGSFDAKWTVIPSVVQFAPDRWHLYYSSNSGVGAGLSSFPGIALAVSSDGRNFEKHGNGPIITPSGKSGDVDAVGIGGGSVLKATLPDGTTEWRYYYTACPTLGEDVFTNQQKVAALAVSQDGIAWEKRGGVMYRDPDRDYENVAIATPVVHQEDDGSYRMWYSAIGTRWGFYSLCYAESDDGLSWRRGEHYGDNLQLGPTGNGFERQMVEYPSVVRDDGGQLRLFYSANGYGSSGTGTAVASPLRATPEEGSAAVRIVAERADGEWLFRSPEALLTGTGLFKTHDYPTSHWHGPLADGTIWHEWQTNEPDLEVLNQSSAARQFNVTFDMGIHYRVTIRPAIDGLDLRFTATNISDHVWQNVSNTPCLGRPNPRWQDADMSRTFIVADTGLIAVRDADRGTGDPIRTHFKVSGSPSLPVLAESFWGKHSETVSHGNGAFRTRDDGRFTIGVMWQQVTEIYQNGDAHHCIHSVATLGDLQPGETKSVKGKIVLVEGDAQACLDAITKAVNAL